jgi:hypothetical protein
LFPQTPAIKEIHIWIRIRGTNLRC